MKIISALGAVALTWFLTANYKDTVHASYINKLRAEQSEAVRKAESEARKYAEQLERKYYELSQEHDTAYLRNLDLAADIERLRSKGAGADSPACRDDAGPASARAAAPDLSNEDIRFLIDLAREADAAASYAMMCYEWVNR